MSPPDEDAFRLRRRAVLDFACPFERALLAQCVACSRAHTALLAEREAIGCDARAASERCHAFRDRLRTASRFALRADPSAPWPFSKEIRAQCGGLNGLGEALGENAAVADVDALMQRALQRHHDFDGLAWPRIIRAVIRREPRRRAPR